MNRLAVAEIGCDPFGPGQHTLAMFWATLVSRAHRDFGIVLDPPPATDHCELMQLESEPRGEERDRQINAICASRRLTSTRELVEFICSDDFDDWIG